MSVKYTKEHEWVRVEGDIATCGISAFAAEQLGDVVYVELPNVGKAVEKDGEMAVVESAKAASDVFAPISGEIIEINEALADAPERVNEDAEGEGWFVKLKVKNASELAGLMDGPAYKTYTEGL